MNEKINAFCDRINVHLKIREKFGQVLSLEKKEKKMCFFLFVKYL